MEKTNITLDNEKELLPSHYPTVLFGGKKVKYNPARHQLEKGEAARYLIIEAGEIRKGVIRRVEYSLPFRIPIYTIGRKHYMHHRVWPDVADAKKHRADRKKALSKLTKKDRKILGV